MELNRPPAIMLQPRYMNSNIAQLGNLNSVVNVLDQEERKSFGSFDKDGPARSSSSSEEEVHWSMLPPIPGSKRER